MSSNPEIRLRAACDSDADGIIAVIDRAYREHPGCVLDVDAEEPGLRAPASSFDGFWVLERDGNIVGSCGYRLEEIDGSPMHEVMKVYLDADLVERARRRHEELLRRGQSLGFMEVMEGLRDRDAQDMGRAIAPLQPADDAVFIDSTALTAQQVVDRVLGLVATLP